MRKIGSFKIETSFNITGRGIVAVGQVIEGIPKLGRYLSINIAGKENLIKIIGIELGNPDKNGVIRNGLLLSIEDLNLKKFVADNKLSEQIATILEAD